MFETSLAALTCEHPVASERPVGRPSHEKRKRFQSLILPRLWFPRFGRSRRACGSSLVSRQDFALRLFSDWPHSLAIKPFIHIAAADDSLQSALSTADPYLQALAWDLKTRVAIAESDLSSARGHIEETLSIVDRFEILVPAWQAHATAWQLFRSVKEYKKAETHRDCAKACIIRIADSFASDEPLRATFLAAAPVRRILRAGVANKETRQHDVMLSAAS